MAVLPNQALQRFEDYKDNPLVQALRNFITLNLGRPLEQVASWGVEITDKPSRAFYVKFTDGIRISGKLELDWQIHTSIVE